MSAVCQCDLCKNIFPLKEPEDKYCDNCDHIVRQIKADTMSETYAMLNKKYGDIVAAQHWVLDCLRYMRDDKLESFTADFGPVGIKKLAKALSENAVKQPENNM